MKHYYITTEPPIISTDEPLTLNSVIDMFGNKVIAGCKGVPDIDYSALSDEDCKKIGWVDVEKFFEIQFGVPLNNNAKIRFEGFIEGFKTAKSLNDKKWSDEDVKPLLDKMYQCGLDDYTGKDTYVKVYEECLQSLNQPKVFEIEAIVQDNKVKILKVL